MNKTISYDGLMPLRINHFEFDRDAINAITTRIGQYLAQSADTPPNTPVIVAGVKQYINSLYGGVIYYSGELFEVDDVPSGNVNTYYLAIQDSWDTNGLVQFFDGASRNTRKIRKMFFTPNASDAGVISATYTYSYLDSNRALTPKELKSITDGLASDISDVATDLTTHEAIGNNHDFLPNHENNGNVIELNPTITPTTGTAVLDTSDTNSVSEYYVVGNLVTYNFRLKITFTSSSGHFYLEFATSFPNGWGKTVAVSYTSADASFEPAGTATMGSYYVNMLNLSNPPRINFRPIGVSSSTDTSITGTYYITGTLILKKDTGEPVQ